MDTDGNIRCMSGLFAGRFSLAATTGGTFGGMFGLILLFVFFVLCGAYFGATESGFSAMNKIRIKAKAEDGNKRAKLASQIANDFDRALTTLLIGNNISHIAAASIATLIATRLFGASDTVTLLCTVITTLIVFLFSEMIPKAYANDRSERTVLFSAGSLRILMKIFSPLTAFFTWISSGMTKFISRFIKPKEEPSMTGEELHDLIDTIEEEGVLDEEQGDLFKSALDFSGTCAKDVMTMRQDIEAISIYSTQEELLELAKRTTHSRIPVYRKDLDHIVGVLQIRRLIKEYLKTKTVNLPALLLPTTRVRPDAKIDDLLSEMQQRRFYLAVVADEKGKTLGLVTVEDFLEELVGEIWDENEVVDQNFIKLGGNRFRVNPRLTVAEIYRRIGIPTQGAKVPHRPILSILLQHFGRIPKEEESFFYRNFEVTVESVENGKVTSVILRLLDEAELAEERAQETNVFRREER